MLLARSDLCGDWLEDSSLGIVHVKRVLADVDGYYGLLGLEPDASESEVRSAAKRKMLETHPDLGGDEGEFMSVMEAYKTLSDSSLRAEYDAKDNGIRLVEKRPSEGFSLPQSAKGEPAWFKEPTMVLDEGEVGRVRKWHGMLLRAARERRLSLKVKAGVCRYPHGFYIEGDTALIGRSQEPDMRMARAFMLMEMTKGLMKC